MYVSDGGKLIKNQESFKGMGSIEKRFRPERAKASGAKYIAHILFKQNRGVLRRRDGESKNGRKEKGTSSSYKKKN